ncbi:MAG: hypothetical protein A2451_07475 [Bdellovibrionales bacterium RIFOXYC2_FULL_39_8]|nr:MAG: hypothetical protein A2451_07475 [Bdellovibrionales bacterium RIFOXYC2_FULL_39_8]HLE12339.1 BrnT family toxin [Bacteriovoracaceae bacterium]
MKISGLDIDEGNRVKIQKHGVSIELIETLFTGEYFVAHDERHSDSEDRFLSVGQVGKKFLFVSFTVRAKDGKMYFRPISARFARVKEVRRLYEKIYKETE